MKKFIKHLFTFKDQREEFSQIEKGVFKGEKIDTHVKQSLNARDVNKSLIVQFNEENYFIDPLVNQKINNNIELIRKSRFFAEYQTENAILIFAKSLFEGEYVGGSSEVKSRAFAWCARLITIANPSKAYQFLSYAKSLGSSPEIEIAEAFLYSQEGDKNTSLSILAKLDNAAAKSAALRIVNNQEGAEEAIKWLHNAQIDGSELDSEGKALLLTLYLNLEYWQKGQEVLKLINDNDMKETPILYHWAGLANLMCTVPIELRSDVLQQVPFNAESFPLASHAVAIKARQRACNYFILAADTFRQLNLANMALIDEEYALWLELRDPDGSSKGIQKLKEKFRNSKSSLHLVYLGVQFNINLDSDLIEQEIKRQNVLNGGIIREAAIARFALAFAKKKPEEVFNYLEKYKEEIVKFINKKSLLILQLEMLTKAGMNEKASIYLSMILEEGISEEEELRLNRIISVNKNTNIIESLKAQFNETDSLGDLYLLVSELKSRHDWENLSFYAAELFEKTHAKEDAEILVNALTHIHKHEQVVQFIKEHSSLLSQSDDLLMNYCWSLYYEGALLEARSELLKFKNKIDNKEYKSLLINIYISLGDWNSLTVLIANEWMERSKRSAEELIRVAQIALYLDSPHAKELLFSAVEKCGDEPNILASAYFFATNAGWEDDVKVSQWLNKATMLSGDNGPIQTTTIEEFISLKPEWDHRERETMEHLVKGEIPMFLAAESLNKSLIQMMLYPTITNLIEHDLRRKVTIPAFSGKSESKDLLFRDTIALDASALLTLSSLDILDKVLDTFDKVLVPHSTLIWLFEEKQKVAFHQPSRIRKAHQLQHLLARGIIEKHKSNLWADSELTSKVGSELANLITDAKRMNSENKQGVVVRTYPVYKTTSFMKEEADLREYYENLSSCQAVVQKLRNMGHITAEQEKQARAYLQIQEIPWPEQPEIEDGAILFFDNITVHYFLHLGLLEKLKAAGFKIIVSTTELQEANELISYESNSDKIEIVIESIRFALNLGIESGKVVVAKKRNFNLQEKQIMNHPTIDLFSLIKDSKAIIVDDRYLNQHAIINEGQSQASIFSTIDLINSLKTMGVVSETDTLEYKTTLRRSGYCFVPLCNEELKVYFETSTIKDGSLIETAELKAIRESILLVRMRTWLQLPEETHWLSEVIRILIQVLHEQWLNETNYSVLHARSNWILRLIDIRGWIHLFQNNFDENIFVNNRGMQIISLLAPSNIPKVKLVHYWKWIEETILLQIKEQYPHLYNWIIEWYQKQLKDVTNSLFSEEKYSD